MTTAQIVLYLLLMVVAVFYLRKLILGRGIQQYDASSASTELAERHDVLFLDVRSAAERSRNKIPGSVHIPLQELKGRIPELERHRNKEIICYCASGSRSLSAAFLLKRNGYRTANLAGGISSWKLGV